MIPDILSRIEWIPGREIIPLRYGLYQPDMRGKITVYRISGIQNSVIYKKSIPHQKRSKQSDKAHKENVSTRRETCRIPGSARYPASLSFESDSIIDSKRRSRCSHYHSIGKPQRVLQASRAIGSQINRPGYGKRPDQKTRRKPYEPAGNRPLPSLNRFSPKGQFCLPQGNRKAYLKKNISSQKADA